jgi:rhodanese-related sulfurtransferase
MTTWCSRIGLVLLLFVSGSLAADELKFPHRTHFKQVPVMELEQLYRQLDTSAVVDVRSRYEYDVLHIKGALHIPLHKDKLPKAVRELRATTDRPIVFYCNGTTCKKSYEAAELAIQAGVTGVYAYDAGIDTWSRKFPELSVLLGKSPVHPSQLISNDAFKKRLISVQDFEDFMGAGAIVLDIRDLRQRDVMLFPMREMRATLDDADKLALAVAEAKRVKKPLLVYDKVGKQIRWFQYYLEQQGVRDYYFLTGGAEGYHEAKLGKNPIQIPD